MKFLLVILLPWLVFASDNLLFSSFYYFIETKVSVPIILFMTPLFLLAIRKFIRIMIFQIN